MNHIYRTIYNRALGAWVAVAETAKSHSKTASSHQSGLVFNVPLKALTLAVLMGLGVSQQAMADEKRVCWDSAAGAVQAPTSTANGTFVCGPGAVATSLKSIAIGDTATVGTYANNSIAMGQGATVVAGETTALQRNSYDAMALGTGANVKGNKTIAIGANAAVIQGLYDPATGTQPTNQTNLVRTKNSIAIGQNALVAATTNSRRNGGLTKYLVTNALAIGSNAKALDGQTTAVGNETEVHGYQGVALGSKAVAKAQQSTAIGNDTVAWSLGAVSIGGNDTHTRAASGTPDQPTFFKAADNTTDIYYGKANNGLTAAGDFRPTLSGGRGATSIGVHAQTLSEGSVAIGIAATAGKMATSAPTNADAVDSATFESSTGKRATAIGAVALAQGKQSTAIGVLARATGDESSAIGSNAEAIGVNSSAMGYDSTAYTEGSIAIGEEAVAGVSGSATNLDAIAIGTGSKATGKQSVAIGYQASTNNTDAVAIGTGAKTTNHSAVAVGERTEAAVSAVAVGDNAKATASSATAIGVGADATNTHDIAIGSNSAASGSQSIAVGWGAVSDQQYAIAQGWGAHAKAESAVAIGSSSLANQKRAVALGQAAKATTDDGVALGSTSTANRAASNTGAALTVDNTQTVGSTVYALSTATDDDKTAISNTVKGTLGAVSVGTSTATRQIINLAAGTADSDAVNVAQLRAVSSHIATTNTTIGNTSTTPAGLVTYDVSGQNATKNNDLLTTVKNMNEGGIKFFHTNDGTGSQTTGGNHSGNTKDAQAIGNYSTGIGYSASANTESSIAIGNAAVAGHETDTTKKDAIAIGTGAKATGNQSISIGTGNVVTGNHSGAIGDPTYINADDSYAIGNNNNIAVGADKTFILGNNVSATAANNVILGNNSSESSATTTAGAFNQVSSATVSGTTYSGFAGTASGIVSVGKTGEERQIINVAPGAITAASTDAINGSQLFSVAKKLDRDTYFHTNSTATAVGYNSLEDNKGKVDETAGAFGAYSLAAGFQTHAVGQNSVAVGFQNKIRQTVPNLSDDTTALGQRNEADNTKNGVLLGANNTIAASNSVATIGGSNAAVGSHASSLTGIGNRLNNGSAVNIVGIANTVSQTSGLTLTQLTAFAALQAKLQANPTATLTPAEIALIDELSSNMVSGTANKLIGSKRNSVLGNLNTLTNGTENFVAGFNNKLGTDLNNVQVIGSDVTVSDNNQYSVAIGSKTKVEADNSVALGYQSRANRVATTAGAATSAAPTVGSEVYALGSASATDKTAISNTVIGSNGAVSVGNEAYSYTEAGTTVNVAANTRQITNLAAGAADTDAVNVAQLKAVANATTAPLTVAGNTNADTDAETIAGTTYKAGDGTQQQLGETLNIIGSTTAVAGVAADATGNATAGAYSAKNVQTVVTNGQVQIQLAENPEFKSIKAGDDIANNPITIGTNSTTNKNEITGLDGSLPDTYNTTTGGNTITKAQVAPTLSAAQKSNAATVNDVLNSGWNLQAKGDAVDFVKPYDTVNFTSSDGSVTITPETDGTVSKIDLKVDVQDTVEGAQLPVVYTNAAGDKVYKQVDNLGNVTFTTNPDGTGTTVPNGDVIASMQNADGSTTAPTTLSNVASTLPNTYNTTAGGNTITTAQAAPTLTAAQKSNAATVGDVLNAGFNLKTTDKGDLDFVKAYDTIEFTDGTGTKVVSETDGTASKIKFNVNTDGTTTKTAPIDPTDPSKGTQIVVATGGITTNANGTVAGNTTNGTIATVGDVATAINNAGWNVQGNGNQVDLVTAGNTVNFADGAGTKANVVHSGGTTTVKYDASVDNTTITVNNAGQLTASGTGIANATNLNYSANGGADQQVTLAKGLDFVNGANGNITASVGADGKVQHTLNKDITVDNITVNKGVTVANGANVDMGNNVVSKVSSGLVDANGAPVTIANASGDTLTNAANIGDLQKVQTGLGNTYQVIGGQSTSGKAVDGSGAELTDSKGNPITAQVALKTYNPVHQGEKINNTVISAIKHMNEGGIKYFHTNDTKNNYATSQNNSEDSQAGASYSTAIGYNAKTTAGATGSVAMGRNTEAGGVSSVAIGDGSKATGNQSIAIGTGNVVTGNNSGAIGDPTYINADDSYAIGNNNTIAAGSNQVFVLGNKVNVGAGHTGAVVLGDKSTIDTAHTGNYTLNGARDAQVAGSKGAGTQVVSVGSVGNERQIQNVAPGVVGPNSTDAINGSQLYHVARQVGGVQRDIANVRADANAGTASAIAIASIGQAHKPGGKTVGMGVGTYRGESAISIGGSVISDNGKWILKGAINSNTRGHVGAGASVNYHW